MFITIFVLCKHKIYAQYRSKFFINRLLSPSNIYTLWENEFVYQETENKHACHVHKIQFCILVLLSVYVFWFALITKRVKNLDYAYDVKYSFYRQHQVWRSTCHNRVCQDDDHQKHHNHRTAHAKIHEVME